MQGISRGQGRPRLEEIGEEPDARFSFANERTFLAWIRTALAMVVAGLGIIQLLPAFSIPGGRKILGLPLIALGAGIAFTSYARWERNERALRTDSPLPRSAMPMLVAFGIGIASGAALILAMLADRR